MPTLFHTTKEGSVGRNWRKVKTEAFYLLALLPRNPRLRCTGFKSGASGPSGPPSPPQRHLHLKMCHAPLVMEKPSVWVSFPSAFSSSLPFPFLLFCYLWHLLMWHLGTPLTSPPISFPFSIFIAAIFLLRFDFGHPQKEEGNIGREGSRG